MGLPGEKKKLPLRGTAGVEERLGMSQTSSTLGVPKHCNFARVETLLFLFCFFFFPTPQTIVAIVSSILWRFF